MLINSIIYDITDFAGQEEEDGSVGEGGAGSGQGSVATHKVLAASMFNFDPLINHQFDHNILNHRHPFLYSKTNSLNP